MGFLESSVEIFDRLTQSIEGVEGADSTSGEFDSCVQVLLRGEEGEAPQQILIAVSLALERRDDLSGLRNFLKSAADQLGFRAFRVLDQNGRSGTASRVLTDRLISEGGLIDIANSQYQEIKVNVGHIASGENPDSRLYWQYRAKQFKYALIDELKYYVEAARFVMQTSANTFSSSTSDVMNYVLAAKQTTKKQQDVLTKSQSGGIGLSSYDLNVVNLPALQEFLYYSLEDANGGAFAQRLQAITATLPDSNLFEDVYDSLSVESGKQWNSVKQLSETFVEDIEEVHNSCQIELEKMFSSIDYTDLPPHLEIEQLLEPFMGTTRAAIEAVEQHIAAWLSVLSQNQKKLG